MGLTALDLLNRLVALAETFRSELAAEQVPEWVMVPSGENLQATIDAGFPRIALEPGGSYLGITISKPLHLKGNGASLIGWSEPALYVTPATHDVLVTDVVCTADWRGPVVLLGDNSSTTQGSLELVPSSITLERVSVPSHRGKAAFEINASDVYMRDCSAHDVWDPALADSKAIYIMNTPGPVHVDGGTFVAGSENIMVGGDTIKIPGVVASDILIENVTLSKPESWRADGINRAVKNLFELKAGRRVTLRNSLLSGSWHASQDGWAIVITPKNGQWIEDVLIEHTVIERAAGGVQFMGLDYNSVTPSATKGIVIRDCSFTLSKLMYGGRGILALYTGGMLDSTWERVSAKFDGTSVVVCDSKTPTGPFVMRDSSLNPTVATGFLGCMAPGINSGGPTPPSYVGREFAMVFENNTFTQAPKAFRANFPLNTYL